MKKERKNKRIEIRMKKRNREKKEIETVKKIKMIGIIHMKVLKR